MTLPRALTPFEIVRIQLPVVVLTLLLWRAHPAPWSQALFAGGCVGLISTWLLALRLWTLRARPGGVMFKMLVSAVSRLALFIVALMWMKSVLSVTVAAGLLAGFFISQLLLYPPILRPKE